MTTSLFSLLLLITLAHATLQDQRLDTARARILRTRNSANMNAFYSDTYTTPDFVTTIRDVGDYGPRLIALEYDNLVLDLAAFVGYDPYVLFSYWDPSTIQWITPDILRIDWTIDIKTGFNTTSGTYVVDGKGFRNTDYLAFVPGSTKATSGYIVQDPAAIVALATQDSITSNEYICNSIILPACNGTAQLGYRPYLADTGYATAKQCIDFLNSLPATDPCPFVRRSNTAACRNLHGFSSFFLPAVHCSHVRPDSMVCKDSCLPACSNCHPNAECIADFPNFPFQFDPVFQCKCKNGFIGNGTSCVAKPCSYGTCPSQWGTYECSTGNCKCRPGFDANPQANLTISNLCTCPVNQSNVTTGAGVTCLPVGRCIDAQWQCNKQSYSQVKCLAVANSFTKFKACICNYGFEGGWEYPCSCPAGRRTVWSDALNGEVCLSPTECTTGWHCPSQTCQVNSTSVIGRCV